MLNSFAINSLIIKNNFLKANPDVRSVYRSNSININVLFNDVLDGTPVVNVTVPPLYGTAIVQGDNTITYTNNGNTSNSDVFTYTLFNGITQVSTTVSINISDVPTPGGDAVAFSISSQSAAVAEDACAFTLNSTKYYEGSESTPTLADFIYNEAAKTTVFNGGGDYYAIDGGKTIRIAANGEVLDVWLCGGGGGNQ